MFLLNLTSLYQLWILLNVGETEKLLRKIIGKVWQGTVSGLFRDSPGKARESRCNEMLIAFPDNEPISVES